MFEFCVPALPALGLPYNPCTQGRRIASDSGPVPCWPVQTRCPTSSEPNADLVARSGVMRISVATKVLELVGLGLILQAPGFYVKPSPASHHAPAQRAHCEAAGECHLHQH